MTFTMERGSNMKMIYTVYNNGGLLCTTAPVVSPRKQHYHSHPALTSLSTDGWKWQKRLSCSDSGQLGPALSNMFRGKKKWGRWKCPDFKVCFCMVFIDHAGYELGWWWPAVTGADIFKAIHFTLADNYYIIIAVTYLVCSVGKWILADCLLWPT